MYYNHSGAYSFSSYQHNQTPAQIRVSPQSRILGTLLPPNNRPTLPATSTPSFSSVASVTSVSPFTNSPTHLQGRVPPSLISQEPVLGADSEVDQESGRDSEQHDGLSRKGVWQGQEEGERRQCEGGGVSVIAIRIEGSMSSTLLKGERGEEERLRDTDATASTVLGDEGIAPDGSGNSVLDKDNRNSSSLSHLYSASSPSSPSLPTFLFDSSSRQERQLHCNAFFAGDPLCARGTNTSLRFSSAMTRPSFSYTNQSQALTDSFVGSRGGGGSSIATGSRHPSVRHSMYVETAAGTAGTSESIQASRSTKSANNSNRNSLSSVNTFGSGTMEGAHLSAWVSSPPSSASKRPESFPNATNVNAQERSARNTGAGGVISQINSCLTSSPIISSTATKLSSVNASSDSSVGTTCRLPPLPFSGVTPLSQRAQSPSSGDTRSLDCGATPWNTKIALPPSLSDPTVIESEIRALRHQVRQATMVLTHVVQTMTVPSPSALLSVLQHQQQQETVEQQQQQREHSKQQQTPHSRRQQQQQQQQQDRHDCSCALLQASDGGKFGTGREIAFLAACYCLDPWEFQSRVLRQVELMQHDLQTLRLEMLEIEKKATMRLRHEMLEQERVRDKEWVELNERMRNAFMVVERKEEEHDEVFNDLKASGAQNQLSGQGLQSLEEEHVDVFEDLEASDVQNLSCGQELESLEDDSPEIGHEHLSAVELQSEGVRREISVVKKGKGKANDEDTGGKNAHVHLVDFGEDDDHKQDKTTGWYNSENIGQVVS